jgi:hypothetical protein
MQSSNDNVLDKLFRIEFECAPVEAAGSGRHRQGNSMTQCVRFLRAPRWLFGRRAHACDAAWSTMTCPTLGGR